MGTPAVGTSSVVVLASSFYTASLEQPFSQALLKRSDPHSVVCVPYNQLHTFLLDPRSVIAEESPTNVILLLRVEDLIRLELAEHASSRTTDAETILRVFRERNEQFIDVLRRLAGLHLTVLICPSGRGAYDTSFLGNAVRVAEFKIAAELRLQQNHRVFVWSDFERAIQAPDTFNVAGDRLGHVPFSPPGLEALAEFFVTQLGSLPTTKLKTQSGGDNLNLQQFLASLAVEISITPLTPEDEEAAINLIRHTTHFINIPDRKWSAGDIRALNQDIHDSEAWIVRVRDRFGDYGVSGAMTLAFEAETMRTGFWFLSCPVLGKQVEYVVMSWMVQVAESRQAGTIEVPFVKGRDNQVLYAFLAQLAAPSETPATLAPRTQTSFHLPVTSLKDRIARNAPNPTAFAEILSSMQGTDITARVSA
jgi:hypothetical protein